MQNEAPKEQPPHRPSSFQRQAVPVPKELSEEPVYRCLVGKGLSHIESHPGSVISSELSAHPARAWEGPVYLAEPRKRVTRCSPYHLLRALCSCPAVASLRMLMACLGHTCPQASSNSMSSWAPPHSAQGRQPHQHALRSSSLLAAYWSQVSSSSEFSWAPLVTHLSPQQGEVAVSGSSPLC